MDDGGHYFRYDPLRFCNELEEVFKRFLPVRVRAKGDVGFGIRGVQAHRQGIEQTGEVRDDVFAVNEPGRPC